MLVNNTAPLCWAAFHDRHLFNLFKQTAITLVSKQMTNVIKDVVLPIMKSKKAQRKVDKDLANPDGILFNLVYGDVDEACLKLNPDRLSNLDGTDVKQAREEVIANAVMDGNGGIVSEYAELVIQFAFTTLFACAFPGGPAIVLAINMIGLRGELFVGLYATQRPETLTGKYSKRRRSSVAVIIVRYTSTSSFLFYCLLSNHSFPTNPNRITNCFKLILSLFTTLQLHCSCVAILIFEQVFVQQEPCVPCV